MENTNNTDTKKPEVIERNGSNTEEKTNLGMLAHILAIFTGFVGPLIIMLVAENKNDKMHAIEALNWQISYAIYLFASFILSFVFIGIFGFIGFSIANLIFCIMAAVKANNNEFYKYPLTIRLIK